MYKYVLNSVIKISTMFVKYFEYYTIILREPFFRGHAAYRLHCMLLHLSFFLHFPYLSFPLRLNPLRFQARGRMMGPNLGFLMVALCNRADHIYFHPVICSFFFFSSPNLSGQRLDVCHTSTHGVALVQI